MYLGAPYAFNEIDLLLTKKKFFFSPSFFLVFWVSMKV
jgi:hypothetical protein